MRGRVILPWSLGCPAATRHLRGDLGRARPRQPAAPLSGRCALASTKESGIACLALWSRCAFQPGWLQAEYL